MAENADQVYKTKDDIVAEVLATLLARIPDANTGPDSIFRIWTEVFANTVEGLYLAQQLLHNDMFVQTANALALIRLGEMYGRPQKPGTVSTGTVRFSGAGGTFISQGTVVSVDRPTIGDTLDFVTTADATIPDPGIPGAPTVADNGAGAMTGTFEYGITFETAEGETELGVVSAALVLAARQVHLSNIPIGGPGTTGRRIYRRVDGGVWGWLHDLADNLTTVYDDNAAATGAGTPPDTSTAERVTVAAQSVDVGSQYNVAVGTITDISDSAADLDNVTNLVAFTGGTDEEDIESFRQALLKWVRGPQSGSLADLEAWAETVNGVESATAFPNINLAGAVALGHVAVRISGPAGAIPDAGIVAEVQELLDEHNLANVIIEVGTFDAHVVPVTVDVTLQSGFVLADVTQDVQTQVTNYIDSVPVAGTVHVAGIVAAVFGRPGIETVTVTTPAGDVALGATEKAVPGAITVT